MRHVGNILGFILIYYGVGVDTLHECGGAGDRKTARSHAYAYEDKRDERYTSLARDAHGRDARVMVHAHNINKVIQKAMDVEEQRRGTRERTSWLATEANASRGSRRSSSVRADVHGDAIDANSLRSQLSGSKKRLGCGT